MPKVLYSRTLYVAETPTYDKSLVMHLMVIFSTATAKKNFSEHIFNFCGTNFSHFLADQSKKI